MTLTEDRALGSLLGLAVGDAIGTTLEFRGRDTYPQLTDLVGGGPFDLAPGQWTDDTSMALCLAESLIAHGKVEPRDLMTRFVNWYRHGVNSATGTCFDIGEATRKALHRFERNGDPLAGATDEASSGNGSIMRLAPVAIVWHRDKETARAAAQAQSRTTHGSPTALAACDLLAAVLVDAIATGAKDQALRQPTVGGPPDIAAIAAGAWVGKSRDAIRSSGYAAHTLEAALWAVLSSAGFRDAVLLAANLGDDADTVAAVTGQIAGALWGLSGIPEAWLARLAWRREIEALGRRLFALGSADGDERPVEPEPTHGHDKFVWDSFEGIAIDNSQAEGPELIDIDDFAHLFTPEELAEIKKRRG